MGLISVPGVTDGTVIDASDINIPVNTIVNEINGLLDTNNLADNAVTTNDITDSSVTNLKLATDSVTTSKIADDAVTMPKIYNPYKFRAYRNASQSAGTVLFNTEVFDTNSNYDTTTGRYTAPVDGYYQFNYSTNQDVSAAPQDPQALLYKNGSHVLAYGHYVHMFAGVSTSSVSGSAFDYLVAGDYVSVTASRAVNAGFGTGANSFSGFLVSEA